MEGNNHYFEFPWFKLDFHHFRHGSSSDSDGCPLSNDVEEPRCLFMREGWNEYLRWLWRTLYAWMLSLWDTHRLEWAYLNIIHSGWESLSRMMLSGLTNVQLHSPLRVSVVVLSVMSLGKSSQSILIHEITSHYQCGWFILAVEMECTPTQLNGSQFRQV